MHPANIEKIEASRNTALRSTTSPRDPEKQSLDIANANSQPSKMPRMQHLCFTLLILALLGLTIVSATSSQQNNGNGNVISDTIAKERLRFQELLNSVEPSSLHEVLHTHMKDRYKDGVYQEDKHAMEVVHQENAVVAHSLLELAKRQSGGNSTVVITTTASTTTQVTTTATQTSPPVTSNTPVSPTTSPTSSPAATPTTSSPQVQQSSSPAVQSTSSPSVASTNVKTSASEKVTPAPSRSVTQQILYTSTLPNGGVTTVTSLTVVPGDQAQTAGTTSTNTAKASLQTNSAKSSKSLSTNGLLGALGLMLVFGAL